MKIICINQAPLNPRSKRLSYVDTFLEAGFDFEFWDLTAYFKMSPAKVDSQQEADYVRRYSSLEEVETALSSIDCNEALFFIGVPEKWEHRRFFKLFADHHCKLLRSNPCANTIAIKKDMGDIVTFLKTPGKLSSFLKRRLFSIYCKVHGISYADVFSSSKLGYRTVPINHPDYDDYHKALSTSDYAAPAERYAVFYDSFFPLHPDFKYIHKLSMAVDYQHYLESMNRFFDAVEKKFNVEVIIAAHPSSDYGVNDFNGRKIIKWKTCELTIGAELIINQSSNSTSFAMLANKPIVYITSDDVEKCKYLSRYIETLSSLLGKEKYNIDHCSVDEMDFSTVAEDKRREYIFTYLTDESIKDSTNETIYSDYARSKNNKPA